MKRIKIWEIIRGSEQTGAKVGVLRDEGEAL